ncbi:hypothetical protein Ctha_1286 [Chloroherpeton thalassium ATCC 35110]|uniref:Uncharacterized protein n=1 Tax=Chloroherpeton thalassium (strain ATCC 35110 / GB-78) TaxID=517418 RepID=B3QZ56_CHLT3|nr:hypothetical protein [Chloroherpeton thalassium]ACF13749.1 hypothetical protein Ctha_1286 [Chloroherpeton thalassium ATCC 35110]
MNCTHVQRVTRELWRLLEVYLFFVVSVLGCTGLGKAPSSLSSKSKERNCDRKIEKNLPLHSKTTLIAPPKFVLIGSPFQAVDALPRMSCVQEESTDDDDAIRISRLAKKHHSFTCDAPFFNTFNSYHLVFHSLESHLTVLSAHLTARNLLQISTPLLT